MKKVDQMRDTIERALDEMDKLKTLARIIDKELCRIYPEDNQAGVLNDIQNLVALLLDEIKVASSVVGMSAYDLRELEEFVKEVEEDK